MRASRSFQKAASGNPQKKSGLIEKERRFVYEFRVGVFTFDAFVGKPGGRSGEVALTFCSATVAASASIFAVSSFTLLKFMLVPQLSPASNIKPLSMLPISPSSFSASGNTPPMQVLTERRTPI